MLNSRNTYQRGSAGRENSAAREEQFAPRADDLSPREFSVNTMHRKLRWELIYIIAIVVVLALICAAATLIADMKFKAAQDRSLAVAQQVSVAEAQAAQSAQENGTAQTQTAQQPAVQLPSDRNQRLALDPNFKEWSTDDNNRKVVYLTIDDGPSELTPEVLDTLDRYNAKATFFVVGHNEDYFPLIKEAYDRGHTIGLHTASHDYDQIYSSPEAYFADLDAIGAIVRDQIGYIPCFMRFPGGSSNSVGESVCPGIMDVLKEEVVERGYQYIDWNRSVGDGAEHTTEEIIGYACEPIDEENIVILCHDSAIKQTTLEALPAIIEHYQGLGYSFEALDRDSWICHHS